MCEAFRGRVNNYVLTNKDNDDMVDADGEVDNLVPPTRPTEACWFILDHSLRYQFVPGRLVYVHRPGGDTAFEESTHLLAGFGKLGPFLQKST